MSNYIRIDKIDSANGPGVRTVLWLAGCNHHCSQCHNPETWNPKTGQPFNEDIMKELLSYVSQPFIEGLTLSGGDPLFPSNRETTTMIVKQVKENLPEKNIWLWTGYLWEEIKDLELLKYVDVLIDGPFLISEKDMRLPYSGSRNQRVIDVQKTLSSNEITLYKKEVTR